MVTEVNKVITQNKAFQVGLSRRALKQSALTKMVPITYTNTPAKLDFWRNSKVNSFLINSNSIK